jgi:uncharacterized protein (DUF427 family)
VPALDPIGPGQESVWDYPRPPVIDPSDEEIIVVLGGVEICETRISWRVLETTHPPTYYLPRSAFRSGALQRGTGSSICEWKGRATYFDLVGGTRVARQAAWAYEDPAPGFLPLRDHVAVYPGLVDLCLVDGERVEPQPGGYYGGWITSRVVGPFKGTTGSETW